MSKDLEIQFSLFKLPNPKHIQITQTSCTDFTIPAKKKNKQLKNLKVTCVPLWWVDLVWLPEPHSVVLSLLLLNRKEKKIIWKSSWVEIIRKENSASEYKYKEGFIHYFSSAGQHPATS